MKPNTIQKLLDYYFKDREFLGEMKRALDCFFGERNNNEEIEIDEKMEGLFNEWLIYDFILENGKNLLQDFYDLNPYDLSKKDLKIYQDLQNNEYTLFEVLKVKKGKGIEILSLQSGKKYFVDEFMGTFQIAKGNVIPARVGRVGDCWELTGCNSLLFEIKVNQKMKKGLFGADKITPKTIYDVFLAEKNIDFESEENELNLEEIEERLEEQLDRFGIKKHVSVDLIKKWISDLDWKPRENIVLGILPMLVGLIDVEHNQEDLEEMISLVLDLYNLTPQKNLDGKAPNEIKTKKGKTKNRIDKIVLESKEWFRDSKKAFELLQKKENEEALKYYNKSFETLLKDKTTHPEIYRFFANKATAHFVLGEERKAVKMLEMALELNPNYDFAWDALERYENGEYDSLMSHANLEKGLKDFGNKNRKGTKKFENDSAIIYFNYLQKFKINFATRELTVSDITIIGPNGEIKRIKRKKKKVGRNEPCPCGSGKKFKKCCGK